MKRVGLAGFQLADVNAGGGQTVERKIVFGLEIKVTNEWTNRIIGDRLAPASKRVLSDVPVRGGLGPPPTLAPSGLLGPVTIVSVALK